MTPPQSNNRRDSGVIAVAVMIALIIIGLIAVGLLRLAATRRDQLRAEERRLQADWLAEAGIERAAMRLAESADYEGEAWEVSADELGGRLAATVRIKVEPATASGRRVEVRADYPKDDPGRARRSKRAIIGSGTPTRSGGER